jgi:hypothetical protein
MRARHLLPAAVLLGSLAGCDDASEPKPVTVDGTPAEPSDGLGDDDTTDDEDEEEDDGPAAYAPSARADLRVKRWRQIVRDLGGALALTEDELCAETGLHDCTTIHVVPLGGISVDNGLYAPVDGLSVTSNQALERFVLQACSNRMELDLALLAAGEELAVFGPLAACEGTLDASCVDAQTTELYRRLLARDPIPAEQDVLRTLASDTDALGGDAAAFATTACFMIATTTEFLTY